MPLQFSHYDGIIIIIIIQGGPKKSKPKTHDHNFVKS